MSHERKPSMYTGMVQVKMGLPNLNGQKFAAEVVVKNIPAKGNNVLRSDQPAEHVYRIGGIWHD